MPLVVAEESSSEPEPPAREAGQAEPKGQPTGGWRIVHSSGETVVSDYPALVRCLREKPGARAFKLSGSG